MDPPPGSTQPIAPEISADPLGSPTSPSPPVSPPFRLAPPSHSWLRHPGLSSLAVDVSGFGWLHVDANPTLGSGRSANQRPVLESSIDPVPPFRSPHQLPFNGADEVTRLWMLPFSWTLSPQGHRAQKLPCRTTSPLALFAVHPHWVNSPTETDAHRKQHSLSSLHNNSTPWVATLRRWQDS